MQIAKYILDKGSVKNVVENGEVIGFSYTTQMSQYRGLFLSCLLDLKAIVDGEEYHAETFTISSGTYTLEHLETHGFHRWNFGEHAVVFVRKPGGLAPGKHHIVAGVKQRSSQDNSIGGFGNGADGYSAGEDDFVIE